MKRFAFCVVAIACLSLLVAGAYSQAPPAPTNLTAKVLHASGDDREDMGQAVGLSWQFSTPQAMMSRAAFRVYRSVDDSSSYKQLIITGDHSYGDHDVSVGHTYYYYVTAVIISHDTASAESGRSNTAWAKIASPPGHVTGQISGTIVDSVTGKPLAGVRIRFFRNAHESEDGSQTWSDSLGRYAAVLDTGTYLILAQPQFWPDMMMRPVAPYRAKWYKNAYEPSGATPVAVVDSGKFTADFALVHIVVPVRVHLRGTVRDSAGLPLKGALVLIMRTVQQMSQMAEMNADDVNRPDELRDLDDLGCIHGVLWGGPSDSTGGFDASVLSGNSYIALAEKKGYVPQFFDHKSQPADATIIVVTGDTSGIDFNLNPVHPPQTYTLSGTVRDSAAVRVPSRIVVFPLRPHPEHAVRFASTDSLGVYTVQKILAGRYIVLAIPYGKYAPAFYKAGAYGVKHWKDADTVNVSSGVSGIDIGVVAVKSGGFASLRGRIDSGGKGVSGMNIFGEAADGSVVGYALSDNSGAYEIDGLPPGVTTIVVDGEGYNGAQQQIVIGAADYALTNDFSVSVATSATGTPGGEYVPGQFALGQNYPNPFNPTTTITFALPVASTVTVRVFNILGQQIATLAGGVFGAGSHTAVWDGRDEAGRVMASGVYFYRMDASGLTGGGSYRDMKRMLLLK